MMLDLHAAALSVRQALFCNNLEVIVTAQGGGRAKLHLSPGQARHLAETLLANLQDLESASAGDDPFAALPPGVDAEAEANPFAGFAAQDTAAPF
jgi:hypothetical protein